MTVPAVGLVLQSAVFAARELASPPFRRILWRSLGLTLVLLVLVWIGLTRLIAYLMEGSALLAEHPLLDSFAFVFAGLGIFVGLAYLIPPVSALVAGYFLDDAAELVESQHYPADAPGTPLSLPRSLLYGLRFAGLALMVNLIALALFFVPGVNAIAFFAANGYLLGREYFELAAGRFRSMPEAVAMRQYYRGPALMAGFLVAFTAVIPLVNLTTPLFGVALMVHLHKGLSRRGWPPG